MMIFLRVLNPRTQLQIIFARGNPAPRTVRLQADTKSGFGIKDLTNLSTIYEFIREAENEKKPAQHREFDDNIAYVQWRVFTPTPEPLESQLNKAKNARALIVDLRGNRGGAVEIKMMVGRFEKEPVAVADIVARKKTETIKVKPRHPNLAAPLFILVDSETASAAEIFARHFQSTGRAVVIGDRTSGRVTTARIFPERVGVDVVALFAVEVDVARVVFPGGGELENVGVSPDKPYVPSSGDLRAGRDICRAQAVALARAALRLPEQSKEQQEDNARD